MLGGEIFVPKIPSMNIMELAKALAPECRTEIVGIRPGEKLHELLIPDEDARRSIELDDYYVVKPHFNYWGNQNWDHGRPLAEGFTYTSDRNTEWLAAEQLKQLVEG